MLCIFSICTYAQQITVSGTVTDAENNPLIGAAVLVLGTTDGVITDLDGKYTIKVNSGQSLKFSYVGYQEQTVKVDGRSVINVKLSEGELLDEVVVIGYGTVKKSHLTGAVASVSGKELQANVARSASAALQGRVAGVTVSAANGQPGEGLNINVRGISSLSATSPLYVIDGVYGDINMVDPADIQSIEVLKDASATAIYGARGANGVILVTTKGGKDGRVSVKYNMYYQMKENPKLLETMDPYDYVYNTWAYMKSLGDSYGDGVARYFGLSSTSLGVDYSNEANNLPEVSLQSILPATIRDQTEPDVCVLTLQNADYDTGEVTLEVTATDYDCPMMYYDYSTDGGKTYSELIPWPDLDIMAGTYPDTFTFSLSFTKGETPVITVRGYNQADLFTESEPITFAKPFVDQEKAAEEARQESLAAEEAAASRISETQVTDAYGSVITMADAAGNTGSSSEGKKEVNFGVFLVICIVLVVLLLMVFLLYQIQQSRHRKRRRKAQRRNVSGRNRNHPR